MEVLRSGALVLRFPGSRPDHQRMSFQRCHSPGTERPVVGASNSNFSWKASRPRKEMGDLGPKEPSCQSWDSGLFYTKREGNKIKPFLVPASCWREHVSYFPPAVIHRWAWSGCFL